MRSNFNKEQKQQIVEAYFQSGKSQTAFAPDYGIKANTLSNWVKKYREENEADEVRFVELKSTVVTQRQPIRISKIGRIKNHGLELLIYKPCMPLRSENLVHHHIWQLLEILRNTMKFGYFGCIINGIDLITDILC